MFSATNRIAVLIATAGLVVVGGTAPGVASAFVPVEHGAQKPSLSPGAGLHMHYDLKAQKEG